MVVAMIHDGGDQYAFVKQFDNKNSSAGGVRDHFRERALPHESIVEPTTVVYDQPSVADNFEAVYKLLYFLVAEDALTQTAYRSMDVAKSKAFEKKLRDYTWSLMDAQSGAFSLTMVDEYVFAAKKASSTEL